MGMAPVWLCCQINSVADANDENQGVVGAGKVSFYLFVCLLTVVDVPTPSFQIISFRVLLPPSSSAPFPSLFQFTHSTVLPLSYLRVLSLSLSSTTLTPVNFNQSYKSTSPSL